MEQDTNAPKTVADVVLLTNQIMKTWCYSPSARVRSFNDDSARSLLLHLIKRWLIADPVDFKRVSKFIKFVYVDTDTRMLSGVFIIDDEDQYFRNKHKVAAVLDQLKSLNYDSLQVNVGDISLSSDINNFNFDNITNIKF